MLSQPSNELIGQLLCVHSVVVQMTQYLTIFSTSCCWRKAQPPASGAGMHKGHAWDVKIFNDFYFS